MLPAVIVVAVLNALILWKVFAHLNWRGIATYTTVYAIAYVAFLSMGNNPFADVATYVAIVVIGAPIVLGTFNRMFWSTS